MRLKKHLIHILVLALLLTPGLAAASSAAQFQAEITIKGPGVDGAYKLNMGEGIYRIQKIRGFENLPPNPAIVHQKTGFVLLLFPESKQYMIIKARPQIAMLDPLAGWAMTRKLMIETPGPEEDLEGYQCQTFIYNLKSVSKVVGKMWFSPKLNLPIQDVRYGDNQDAVFKLENIMEGPQDPSLFKLPAGYSKMEEPPGAGNTQ